MEKISEKKVANLGDSIGYFKLNLPNDETSYISGNGEGVWAVVDDKELKEKISNDKVDVFEAYIANDSVYYPGLVCGSKVQAEVRKGRRPVAVFSDLQEELSKEAG